MTSAIRVHDLNYTYPDGTVALENISFEIEKGESVALIGPNGAGKSTLLLHLNGILHSARSREAVEILGDTVDPRKVHELSGKIGIVFQNPDDMLFMPLLSDDVAFGPINLGIEKEEVARRVGDSLGRVGLAGYENRVPHHLSSGEKKRAAIATVLSMEPEIIALDEPTANLDPKSRNDLIGILKNLKDDGKTLLIITHDVNAIPELADRVIVLNKTIVADDTTRDVFANTEMLVGVGLDVPVIMQLFELLQVFGYPCDVLPLSISDAVRNLTETIENGEGHIHLHIHKHLHTAIGAVRSKYQHHPADV
ncbi:MAG: ATP-binding cassette domain-containing protein [Methanosarcinales archaeon]|uniref:ATP-binding cassette domain-containing protein n=1 Tax=Candidatus Ethanoperedens thermophilum TaxID=2766897 RepID=A0A848DBN5_9EURY|nr:ATP-binding cassette domain-containing protein [Candidatus Ethanoperedens thermophilum]